MKNYIYKKLVLGLT